MTVPERILIVRLGALGDVVHGVPVAATLRAAWPGARIDWLVDPRYVPLLDLVECVDVKVPVDPRDLLRRGRRAAVLRTLRTLWRTRYDVAIDLQGLVKSAVLARLSGARSVIGFPGDQLREPLARVCYSVTPQPGAAPHVVHQNLALLRALGLREQQPRFPFKIPETAAANAVRRRAGLEGYVLINPGAAWPNKRWPPDRFGAVASAVHAQTGLRSVVLWGPGEESLAEAVVAASSGAAELAPPTTVADIVALAHTARVMLSGDTGPLHIAGAVGAPLVALFGPTDAERNGPWDARDGVLSEHVRCQCRYARQCTRAVACIDDITVADVVQAVRTRLERAGFTRG
ncbi:MAG: lipopolysaccharide heptosyltransferase I [Vicinamibacterales bacterium]